MRLGIDLGTTRTLVAACDRGNYPLIGFNGHDGEGTEHVPTVTAQKDGVLVHGFAAERAALDGAPHLRSWKRLLGRHGPEHRVRIGSIEVSLLELATSFLVALREEILERSNLPRRKRIDVVETIVSVPANAHSSQRWATLEAFRRAKFEVRAMLNEPSAAGIEFAHRHEDALNKKREHVAVYDLGGGTFDAALVSMALGEHEVVATSGIQELGGDDFDRVLLDLALEKLGIAAEPRCLAALLLECRAAKEGIGSSTRKIVLDLAALGDDAPDEPVVLQVADYYERLRPLVDRTAEAVAQVMVATGAVGELSELTAEAGVAGLYLVGGASALPLVARLLRERFGRRVHRSPHPAGSTAIGLAIAGDNKTARPVREQFTRHLGVFREAASGQQKTFDPIFARGTPMPSAADSPLVATRSYRACHNVGQLRFVECGDVSAAHEPAGDISPHGTVYFPYLPDLRGQAIEAASVARLDGPGRLIEERYEVDGAGVVAVTIRDVEDGYSQRFVL